MTVEELMGDWQEIEPSEEAVVVTEPDGSVAAYADVLNRSYVSVSVYGYVHPEHRGRGVGSYLVRWGEEWTLDRMDRAPEDARVVVQHYVNTLNESAQRLLQASGYTPVRSYYRMAIELEQAPTPPEWPEGIRGERLRAGAGRADRLRGGGGCLPRHLGPAPWHHRALLEVPQPGELRPPPVVPSGGRR